MCNKHFISVNENDHNDDKKGKRINKTLIRQSKRGANQNNKY